MDNWPEAAVAVAGITMVIVITSVLIWQIMRTAQVKLAADGRERLEAQYSDLRLRQQCLVAQQIVARASPLGSNCHRGPPTTERRLAIGRRPRRAETSPASARQPITYHATSLLSVLRA